MWSSMSAKREQEKVLRELKTLRALPCNRCCADCGSRSVPYVCITYSTFVCSTCSGVHSHMGHRVKGITLSKFKPTELAKLKQGGNAVDKKTYLGRWQSDLYPLPKEGDWDAVERFIRLKYTEKKWFDGPSSQGPAPKAAAHPTVPVPVHRVTAEYQREAPAALNPAPQAVPAAPADTGLIDFDDMMGGMTQAAPAPAPTSAPDDMSFWGGAAPAAAPAPAPVSSGFDFGPGPTQSRPAPQARAPVQNDDPFGMGMMAPAPAPAQDPFAFDSGFGSGGSGFTPVAAQAQTSGFDSFDSAADPFATQTRSAPPPQDVFGMGARAPRSVPPPKAPTPAPAPAPARQSNPFAGFDSAPAKPSSTHSVKKPHSSSWNPFAELAQDALDGINSAPVSAPAPTPAPAPVSAPAPAPVQQYMPPQQVHAPAPQGGSANLIDF
ncbi:Arf GTPase activating protein [Kipferlia bialata]|uniref:Arf GTPase activating protein n=1 Tax=Kipferlia bialata TaxID=797122 RepID=A0A9K3GKP0_9EUKA|nr:Arf GTPase activating protein [Kipferlia bialata]|eukprot:g8336.t1